ncbi:MAG: ABC transporter substrate-binding protein [Polyangiaceae bacterium]
MRSTRARAERRRLALAAAACAAAGLSCGERLAPPLHRAASTAGPVSGGTLHLASLADVRSLDPAGPIDGVATEAIQLIFAGLVELDEENEVVPGLAESWSVGADGRSYRFVLRAGVRMHDGSLLTADDVVRSVERALDPMTPNPGAGYFADLEGLAATALDVVVFRIRAPDATFLPRLAMVTLRPTCKSAGHRYSSAWIPCGAGPFALEPGGWKRGVSLRLVKHAGYFRPGLPYLDAVEWSYNVPSLAQRFRFEDGDLDTVNAMTQADLTRFTSDPRWAPYGQPEHDDAIFGEAMNTRLPPFDDVEVRRAVAAAVDRDHYARLQPGLLTPLTQALPPGVLGYDPAFAGQKYDLAAALEHMKKAGFAFDPGTGRGGWPEPVDYLVYDQGIVVYTAQLLQQDLAKIGIRLRIEQVSYSAYLGMHTDPKRPGMSFGSWGMDYADPGSLLEPLFASPPPGATEHNGGSFYANPRLDDVLARARATADGERRAALYREADAIVCDDAPWAFTFLRHFYDVSQPYVHGLSVRSLRGRDASRTWLDPGGAR